MKKLLDKYESRRLSLLELLYYNEHVVTLSFLSEKLNCAERTLKNDINYLKRCFGDDFLKTSNRGIQLQLPKNKGIEVFYEYALRDSFSFSLLEHIFKNDTLSTIELAQLVDTSISTVTRSIQRINDTLKPYTIEITSSPYKIVGDESNIRLFFFYYFSERYSHSVWPYEKINESIFDQLILYFATHNQLALDYNEFIKLKKWLAISLIRTQKKHYISIERPYSNAFIPDLTNYSFQVNEIEKELNLSFNEETIKQLCAFFLNEHYFFNYTELVNRTKSNPSIKEYHDFLSGYLLLIADKAGISLINHDEIIVKMFNISYLYIYKNKQIAPITHILWDRKKSFIQSIEEEYPEFITLAKELLIEQQHSNKINLSEDVQKSLLYYIIVYWDNLLHNLNNTRKKYKLLIFSDFDKAHAKTLQSIFKNYFKNFVSVSIYSHPYLSNSLLKEIDYDILITTTSIENIDGKETIYIHNIPSERDFNLIKNKIGRF
ncbi:MAG: helix-turn-helix domain-containing protein [Carnobacterium sp.]|nr:helix-turn-helix domain-containing protein [Carnobacterium sp.]